MHRMPIILVIYTASERDKCFGMLGIHQFTLPTHPFKWVLKKSFSSTIWRLYPWLIQGDSMRFDKRFKFVGIRALKSCTKGILIDSLCEMLSGFSPLLTTWCGDILAVSIHSGQSSGHTEAQPNDE